MTRGAPPLIGITADSANGPGAGNRTNGEPTLFLPERYAAAIERAGGAPLVLPATGSESSLRRYLDTIDGLLISGGNFDIHPRYYGEEATRKLGNLIPVRTEFELNLARLALRRDLPVLGICGGAQAINVVLGGSLFQDIAHQCPGATEHQQSFKKASGGHRIAVKDGTRLHRIVQRQSLEVNTTHHQAVKQLGKGLVVNAVADDGIIEGIESVPHSFVLGIQWHPEILARRQLAQRRIFLSFVATCRRYRHRA
jgi:putative glutamine amidotransferase